MAKAGGILARICAERRYDIKAARSATPLSALRTQAETQTPPRGFAETLMRRAAANPPAIIAEFKTASPSAGALRPEADPAAIAASYEQEGAACLSVLTESRRFGGSLAHLKQARAATALPVLRKDFILDPWQITQSRAAGADAILLIMAALSKAQAFELEQAARIEGMDVLVEVHNEEEMERALALSSSVLGINNRNLCDLSVDIDVAKRLLPLVPPSRLAVAESGVSNRDALLSLKAAGFRTFLIGESLMRAEDPGRALAALLDAYRHG